MSWALTGKEPTVKVGSREYMLWTGVIPLAGVTAVQILARSAGSTCDSDWLSCFYIDENWQVPATLQAYEAWLATAASTIVNGIAADQNYPGNPDATIPANTNDLISILCKHVTMTPNAAGNGVVVGSH